MKDELLQFLYNFWKKKACRKPITWMMTQARTNNDCQARLALTQPELQLCFVLLRRAQGQLVFLIYLLQDSRNSTLPINN